MTPSKNIYINMYIKLSLIADKIAVLSDNHSDNISSQGPLVVLMGGVLIVGGVELIRFW